MAYLVDTNVMWRRFHAADPAYPTVKQEIDKLLLVGENVCITAQNLIEFQSLATRPVGANGLGYSVSEASRMADEMVDMFSFLPDTPAIYRHWRQLINRYDVKGRQVHDARLVAVMLTYRIANLLTLNGTHFHRFEEITVIEPTPHARKIEFDSQ